LKREPHGSNGDSTSRKFFDWNAEELGACNKSDRRSIEEHEEAIR